MDKLKALKDRILELVDAVKADPKKQLVAALVVGVVIGALFCKLA